MNKVLFISIKPEFTEKIFNGTKSIELRKSTPNIVLGGTTIVYSTSPEKAVVGICRIEEIIRTTPEKMWDLYSDRLGISYRHFQDYYKNSNLAVGLMLTSVYKLDKKISLDVIKKHFPTFNPPQTYKYLGKREMISGYKQTLSSI